MHGQMRQHVLSCGNVDTLIYILAAQQVIEHARGLTNLADVYHNRVLRICYLVMANDGLHEFMEVQQGLGNLKQYELYSISITPVASREHALQHIEKMESVNGTQFQQQYLHMVDLLEQDIESSLIKQFCIHELRWSEHKAEALLSNQGVNRVSKLINYRGFNQLESLKISGIWEFIERQISNSAF